MGDATDTLNTDLVTADEASVLAHIAGAPSTSPPPVDNDHVEPGAEQFAPVITAEPLAPVPESWRACTGQDIQAMIKAAQAGFERTPGFTRADVYAFIATKGL